MIMKYEHTCQDCGYFRPHYIWSRRYQAIDYGHCVQEKRRTVRMRKRPPADDRRGACFCEFIFY